MPTPDATELAVAKMCDLLGAVNVPRVERVLDQIDAALPERTNADTAALAGIFLGRVLNTAPRDAVPMIKAAVLRVAEVAATELAAKGKAKAARAAH